MASYRKLPSGKWQAQIKWGGRRLYKTDPLKRVVVEWASTTEAALRRGAYLDPALGQQSLGEWWAVWEPAQVVERSTRRTRASHWRNHIEPRFGRWHLATIGSWDVEQWVGDMVKAGVGARTVSDVLGLFGQVMRAAVVHQRIAVDPTGPVRAPKVPRHVARVMGQDEVDRLLEGFTMPDQSARAATPRGRAMPRVPDLVSRAMVQLMTDAGPRYGEAAGLHGFRVDLRRRRVRIQEVLLKDGSIKAYPKTHSGSRDVPLTDEMVEVLGPLVSGPRRDGLVFTRPDGGPLQYDNWMKRSWRPALVVAGLEDPQPTPHDCRHTYGTLLADQGVQPHQIRDLMGHSSLSAVQIYLNASESRMEAARAALGARRAHAGRDDKKGPGRLGDGSGA